jgi:hypothetical protein
VVGLFKSKKHILFGVLFLISASPFIINIFTSEKVHDNAPKDELFNPSLIRINSIELATSYVDSIYRLNKCTNFDTAKYVQIVSRFTKERFYHGLTHYSVSENWIASLSGKLLWSHMSAIVNPNDILKYPKGLCSQQAIIFMEILKGKHINVRSVGLGYKEGPGHFLCEVHYNNSWRLHDVTMEPKWEKIDNIHRSMDHYLQHKDSLYIAYESRLNLEVFNKLTEKVVYGNVNEFPAKNMLLFHIATKIITYLLPIVFLLLFIGTFIIKSK